MISAIPALKSEPASVRRHGGFSNDVHTMSIVLRPHSNHRLDRPITSSHIFPQPLHFLTSYLDAIDKKEICHSSNTLARLKRDRERERERGRFCARPAFYFQATLDLEQSWKTQFQVWWKKYRLPYLRAHLSIVRISLFSSTDGLYRL